MNIDTHLTIITNNPYLNSIVPSKDAVTLRSLEKAIKNHYFLTVNQSEILLNILKNNIQVLSEIDPELENDLKSPTWSKAFRIIEIKRIMDIKIINDEKVIYIESNYSNQLKSLMSQVSKSKYINSITIIPGKQYTADLNEKTIVDLVELLQPLNFNICNEILNYYTEIKSWDINTIISKFNIETIENNKAKEMIIEDIGINTPINSLIVADRKVRYQYKTNNTFNNNTLTEHIATRTKTNIWLDNNVYSLSEIIKSLQELNRLPLLVIFDNKNDKSSIQELTRLSEALEQNGIIDNIGIYFRLSNNQASKPFNTLVADKKYNSRLDKTTQIAGIEIGNLPKFFLSTDWKPMSIISLNQHLGNTKTAIYSKQCDLVITYSSEHPLIHAKFY